jgi:5-methylcytosine-specific restriction protein A
VSSTGFPLKVRVLIIERAQGMCERCGEAKPGMQVHHRRPRGMGGSRREDTNRASNGLYLCADCHAWVESYRTEARLHGLLLTQSEYPPDRFVQRRGDVVRLTDDGKAIVLKRAGGVAL